MVQQAQQALRVQLDQSVQLDQKVILANLPLWVRPEQRVLQGLMDQQAQRVLPD